VIDSFRRLASTGAVEFLAETYYHSLSCVSNHEDFRRQVQQHRQAIAEHFGVVPKVFRNTELIYSDEVGRLIREMGFDGIYADGIGKILRYRSPDHLYEHAQGNGLKLFLRNFCLSDDIAFRFTDRKWKEWPLTAEKFTQWLLAGHSPQRLITLGLDYETFGEHHKYNTGIFQFMKNVVATVSKSKKIGMITPSEAITLLETKGRLSSPSYISWADRERDLSAWLGNDLQKDAFDTLKTLGKKIAETGDGSLKSAWNYLQTSDHFYYMSTKKGDDGKVHNYFSPYPSPYEAFMAYVNVITELSLRLKHMKKAVLKHETRAPVGKQKPLMVA
jgi:alpha-amylase